MNLIILIVLIFLIYFIFLKKKYYSSKTPGHTISMFPYVGVSGGNDIIIKRFIFTIKIQKYNNISEFHSGKNPYEIIDFIGLKGKLYRTDYTIRSFMNQPLYGNNTLKPYNNDNEYKKVTYKNKLKIEEKMGLERGIEIKKYEYDQHKRLIRIYKIIDNKEIEKDHYEYDDKNRIITHTDFLDGKLFRKSKIELKEGKNLIDSYSYQHKDWIKKTEVDKNNLLDSIYYYTYGEIEKWEFYDKGKLYSTTIYDPDTGKEIENKIEEEFKEDVKKEK